MLAFIQNINPSELLLIAIAAILIFGRRLPQVAGQAAGRVQQARRAFNDLKRETGIDEELRNARQTFEQSVHDAKYAAKKDPSTPHIEPPSAASRVARGHGDPHAAAMADDGVPPAGGPSDSVHGGSAARAAGQPGPSGEDPLAAGSASEPPGGSPPSTESPEDGKRDAGQA